MDGTMPVAEQQGKWLIIEFSLYRGKMSCFCYNNERISLILMIWVIWLST